MYYTHTLCISNYINMMTESTRKTWNHWWKLPQPRCCERGVTEHLEDKKETKKSTNERDLEKLKDLKKPTLKDKKVLCSCSEGINEPGLVRAPQKKLWVCEGITLWWYRQKYKRELFHLLRWGVQTHRTSLYKAVPCSGVKRIHGREILRANNKIFLTDNS